MSVSPAEAPPAERDLIERDIRTACEWMASSPWGQYLTAVETKAVLFAHEMAAKPSTSLEIGCDGGRWSRFIANLGWSPTCVDIDPETLAVCQGRLPQACCVLTSRQARRLPADDNSTDLLLIMQVPSVIESDWFPSEANRVLRNNGLLVGVGWNRASLRGVVSRLLGRQESKAEECYIHTYNAIKRRIEDSGFSFLFERGYCWVPFSRDTVSPLVPPCVTLERILMLRYLVRWSPWVVFVARKA